MEMGFEGIIEIGLGGFSCGLGMQHIATWGVGCGVWGLLLIAEIFLLGLR
jgi:hypothetical protein